jgi:ABC-2 type transport system ATP-binding protein
MIGEELEDRILRVLAQVGLEDAGDMSGFAMSAGMRARLQIARALLHSPRLLVLDEPTGAVDPIAAFGLISLIRGIAEQQGVAVLVSSHRLDEIESLGKNLLLLDHGRVKFHGDLNQLRERYDSNVAEITFKSLVAAQAAFEAASSGFNSNVTLSLKDEVIATRPQEAVGRVILSMGSHAEGITRVDQPQVSLMELLARMYQPKAGEREDLEPT